jgi:hypothetical protein
MTQEYEYEYRKDKWVAGTNGERFGPMWRRVYKDPLAQEVWNWMQRERKRDSGVPIRKMPAGYNIIYEEKDCQTG